MSIEIKHVKEISGGFTESDRSFSIATEPQQG